MKMRRRNHSAPCPFKTGDRIHPIAMFECHDSRRGETYEVVEIDTNDSTLRARDAQGQVHDWIRWRDCELMNAVGWEWLKGHLPADALELLSAFDALSALRLRPEVRIALLQQLPGLKDKILDANLALESARISNP